MVGKILLEKQLSARLKILQLTLRKSGRFSSKSAQMATLLTAISCLLLPNCTNKNKCTNKIKQEFLDTNSVQLKTFVYCLR